LSQIPPCFPDAGGKNCPECRFPDFPHHFPHKPKFCGDSVFGIELGVGSSGSICWFECAKVIVADDLLPSDNAGSFTRQENDFATRDGQNI